ncbi:MAG: hypothetical protein ACFFC3_05540 [Candidatus Odinarchaeota archaeon]
MKSNKITGCLLIISFFFICYNKIFINEILANPLSPYISSSSGPIIPENGTYSMPNANVLVEIDATHPSSHFNLDFNGNYTIFNPYDSKNVTIVAPFSRGMLGINDTTYYEFFNNYKYPDWIPIEFSELNSNATIKVDNNIIPYNIMFGGSIYLMCNVSLPKNDSLVLEYSLNTHLVTPPILSSSYYEIDFEYYVGTSRTWNGNITEMIDFRVKGYQPDRVYSVEKPGNDVIINGKNFTISSIKGGKSYLWKWNNVRIYEDYVFLSYDIMGGFEDDTISFGMYFMLFTLIGIVLMMTLQKIRLDLKKKNLR